MCDRQSQQQRGRELHAIVAVKLQLGQQIAQRDAKKVPAEKASAQAMYHC